LPLPPRFEAPAVGARQFAELASGSMAAFSPDFEPPINLTNPFPPTHLSLNADLPGTPVGKRPGHSLPSAHQTLPPR